MGERGEEREREGEGEREVGGGEDIIHISHNIRISYVYMSYYTTYVTYMYTYAT